jgi:hypothetical protein
METGLYYLTGPYTGTPEEEAHRFETCLKITTAFISQGISVFSPIVYSKQFAHELNLNTIEERRKIVMNYLLSFLKASKGMILITMQGWEKSWGLNLEIKFCQENKIPVFLMAPEQLSNDMSEILAKPLDQAQVNQLLETV